MILLIALSGCIEDKNVEKNVVATENSLINRVYFHNKKDYVMYYKSIHADKPNHYLGNCVDKWWDYKTGHHVANNPMDTAMSQICMARKEAKEILPNEQLYLDFPDLPRGLTRRSEREDKQYLGDPVADHIPSGWSGKLEK